MFLLTKNVTNSIKELIYPKTTIYHRKTVNLTDRMTVKYRIWDLRKSIYTLEYASYWNMSIGICALYFPYGKVEENNKLLLHWKNIESLRNSN